MILHEAKFKMGFFKTQKITTEKLLGKDDCKKKKMFSAMSNDYTGKQFFIKLNLKNIFFTFALKWWGTDCLL